MSTTAAKLREAVRASGTPLAASLVVEPRDNAEPEVEVAPLAAGGPRVGDHRDDVEIAVAAVEEGYRLHYGQARALRIDDRDLALLAGDRMYALGLARLADAGDLMAIAELADVISLAAQAQASDDADLASAAWQAGAAAIGWGESPQIAAAKTRARTGDPDAAQALLEAARQHFDTPAT